MPLPQPVITGARLGPKPLPFDPDGRLRLAPDQRTFALDYTAPSLRDARGLHFRYRLRGFERGWNEGDAMRMAFYTKVPPGRYTFEVAVERGQGDVRLATLPVRVVPTLWETTWMRVLLALGTLGALGALVQRYLHARKRREAELAHLVEARTAELAEAKDRAERLGEAKTAFLASMSHEIRTPLTAIVGFSEVLLEEVGDAQRGHAELVNRSSRRLRATLTSILDLARLEAGKEDVTLHTVDLAREAREVVEEMRPRAEAKGLALTLDLPTPPACPVRANRSHLGSVLLNLLSNAIKYTDAGGRVTVAVTDPPDPDAMPHVMVRDTGMGMDADTQAVVFEPFVRQDRRTVDDRDGAGLGLAITQKLVDLMGGRITLDSAPGEGSTFTVYLPRGD
jgi:signal transduction histidine kinase